MEQVKTNLASEPVSQPSERAAENADSRPPESQPLQASETPSSPSAPRNESNYVGEVKAAASQAIPSIPKLIDAYINRYASDTRGSWIQDHIDLLARYGVTLVVIVVVGILAGNRLLSGDAVTGFLGILAGYIWGRRQNKEGE